MTNKCVRVFVCVCVRACLLPNKYLAATKILPRINPPPPLPPPQKLLLNSSRPRSKFQVRERERERERESRRC